MKNYVSAILALLAVASPLACASLRANRNKGRQLMTRKLRPGFDLDVKSIVSESIDEYLEKSGKDLSPQQVAELTTTMEQTLMDSLMQSGGRPEEDTIARPLPVETSRARDEDVIMKTMSAEEANGIQDLVVTVGECVNEAATEMGVGADRNNPEDMRAEAKFMEILNEGFLVMAGEEGGARRHLLGHLKMIDEAEEVEHEVKDARAEMNELLGRVDEVVAESMVAMGVEMEASMMDKVNECLEQQILKGGIGSSGEEETADRSEMNKEETLAAIIEDADELVMEQLETMGVTIETEEDQKEHEKFMETFNAKLAEKLMKGPRGD